MLRHRDWDSVSIHYSDAIKSATRPKSPACRLFAQPFVQAQIAETSKLRATGLCEGIHRWPVDSPHKRPAMRKMFPFDHIIGNCPVRTHGASRSILSPHIANTESYNWNRRFPSTALPMEQNLRRFFLNLLSIRYVGFCSPVAWVFLGL